MGALPRDLGDPMWEDCITEGCLLVATPACNSPLPAASSRALALLGDGRVLVAPGERAPTGVQCPSMAMLIEGGQGLPGGVLRWSVAVAHSDVGGPSSLMVLSCLLRRNSDSCRTRRRQGP